MKYLFLLFAAFSSDLFAEQACPYGFRNDASYVVGSWDASECNLSTLPASRIAVSACVKNDSYYAWTVQTVKPEDCASTPSDDSGENGCYGDQLNNPAHTCSGEENQQCTSPNGTVYFIEKSKSCSDYCPGSGSNIDGKIGPGTIHKCDGPYGDPN